MLRAKVLRAKGLTGLPKIKLPKLGIRTDLDTEDLDLLKVEKLEVGQRGASA